MKARILVVEDDIEGAENLKTFLGLKDFDVHLAIDGKDGLDVLSKMENPPDLIISDIIMPEMNGYDFYMKVMENTSWSRIPFFFLSAKKDFDDVWFGKLLGADDYIVKPFSFENLTQRIEKKIRESKANIIASDVIEGKLVKFWKLRENLPIESDKIKYLYVYYVIWDEVKGASIINYFPKNEIPSLNLNDIVIHLYDSLIKVYDFKKVFKSTKYVFRIIRDLIDAYILIDKKSTTEDKSKIGVKAEDTHMLCTIAPHFHYLQSERIKETLENLTVKIKNQEEWEIREEWEKLLQIYQNC